MPEQRTVVGVGVDGRFAGIGVLLDGVRVEPAVAHRPVLVALADDAVRVGLRVGTVHRDVEAPLVESIQDLTQTIAGTQLTGLTVKRVQLPGPLFKQVP